MILTGRKDRATKLKNDAVISFVVPFYMSKYFDDLDEKKDYKIEITEIKSKRSLRQNNLMWELIGRIATVNGMDPDDVYCQLIKMARIRTEIIQTLPEAKKALLNAFRMVVERDTRINEKGVQTKIYECYYGSSTFTQDEMSTFIDRLLEYAESVGIDTREYGGIK